jgi:hypothetical protein
MPGAESRTAARNVFCFDRVPPLAFTLPGESPRVQFFHFFKNLADKYFNSPSFRSGSVKKDKVGTGISKWEWLVQEMKCKRSMALIAFLLFLGIPFSIQASDQEWDQEEIFSWVAGQLGVSPGEERPQIVELPEQEFREQFLNSTEKSLKRLRESLIGMGWDRVEASNYLENLTKDVAGFLTKKDLHIYIKNSLEPCYKASIVAHEITHFFQIKHNLLEAEARELQAEHIEKKYREEHCTGP